MGAFSRGNVGGGPGGGAIARERESENLGEDDGRASVSRFLPWCPWVFSGGKIISQLEWESARR